MPLELNEYAESYAQYQQKKTCLFKHKTRNIQQVRRVRSKKANL